MRPLQISAQLGIFLIAWLLPMASATAQTRAATASASADTELRAPLPISWVEIDGHRVLPLRGIPSYPAERRVAVVSERIRQAAQDEQIAPNAIRVVRTPIASEVWVGSRYLVAAIDLDANAELISRELLAESYVRRLRPALEQFRVERSAGYLQMAALRSLLGTVAFAAIVWLIVALRRRISMIATARYKQRVHDIAIQTFQILQAQQIWTAMVTLLHYICWFVVIIATYLYLQYVLSQFPWTRGFANELLALLVNPLQTMGRLVLASIPNLIFLALLYVVVRYVLRLAQLFFSSVARGTIKFENFYSDWAAPTYRAVRLLVVLFAIVIAYPYIPGSQSDAFKGLSILVGIMFSIGSSSFVANLIAGYALTYRRVFTSGEWIEIDKTVGQVTQTRLQVTHLRTPKNEEIIIPNSLILTSPVINYSKLARDHGLILHTTVGIGYETPWRQVEAMLLMAAQRTSSVLQEPAPFVLQRSLGDFSVNYELNAYCRDAGTMFRARSELHSNILDVFNEYGVQIMTPAYECDPLQAKVVPRDQWFSAPARPNNPGVSPTEAADPEPLRET